MKTMVGRRKEKNDLRPRAGVGLWWWPEGVCHVRETAGRPLGCER